MKEGVGGSRVDLGRHIVASQTRMLGFREPTRLVAQYAANIVKEMKEMGASSPLEAGEETKETHF